ncbi:hypothetical protein [Rhizobium oryzicola]|uniref:DUF2497 domain-containing protein n=1 Tax=Rhizobium oryzicola TaxID=1232668 RepID=A0ABT8SWA1_9HYPH|nr:hypothetical protein [Rhizobium oryzicola]MDO1582424.1 hypothetical protein [Rhizobium oryzicola]
MDDVSETIRQLLRSTALGIAERDQVPPGILHILSARDLLLGSLLQEFNALMNTGLQANAPVESDATPADETSPLPADATAAPTDPAAEAPAPVAEATASETIEDVAHVNEPVAVPEASVVAAEEAAPAAEALPQPEAERVEVAQ